MRAKSRSKTGTARVRVTLEVPKYLIPKGEEEPVKALAALLTAAFVEFRISVLYINPKDVKNLTRGGVK